MSFKQLIIPYHKRFVTQKADRTTRVVTSVLGRFQEKKEGKNIPEAPDASDGGFAIKLAELYLGHPVEYSMEHSGIKPLSPVRAVRHTAVHTRLLKRQCSARRFMSPCFVTICRSSQHSMHHAWANLLSYPAYALIPDKLGSAERI